MMGQFSLARLCRLCLKELRESLRDRRTIITLVLMPLLVYPLLSLILQRVLLTSKLDDANLALHIGVERDEVGVEIDNLLSVGAQIMAQRQRQFSAQQATESEQSGGPNSSGEASTDPQEVFPKFRLNIIGQDSAGVLSNGMVDILITTLATSNLPNAESDQESTTLESTEPTAGAQQQAANPFPRPLRYVIHYRQNDLRSERAASFVQRAFLAVNYQFARDALRQMGARFPTPVGTVVKPMRISSDNVAVLATLVPLVLVLMTIAGAVYPAIDLTAGERERGTMEALIVSPTPSAVLLLAKYVAVMTVALLTALANLLAMSVTLWASGLGRLVFGEAGISPGTIAIIFPLLVLFAMFFSAVLLAITSFARSFKEAQAYLIPLMLLALAPGVLSLLPGIEFNAMLAAIPLVNIVLLAREVLTGSMQWDTGGIAIGCTVLYAIIAIFVASRLFGNDASLQGSQGSWRDLLRRPMELTSTPTMNQMAFTMAVLFPLYFVASSTLPAMSESLATKLMLSAVVSFALIMGLPSLVTWYRKISWKSTYRLNAGSWNRWMIWIPAVVLIAGSIWTIGHEIIIVCQSLGIATIRLEQFKLVAEFNERLQALPLLFVLCVLAVTPAVCEEWFFRGFVLSSMRQLKPYQAILGSAALFGLMHVLTSNVLAIERFFPTTFIGIILGWIAVKTNSIWPGMLLHGLHNSLILSIAHFQEQLQAWGIGLEEQQHLPAMWLIGGATATVIGLLLVWFTRPADSAETTEELVSSQVGELDVTLAPGGSAVAS